MTRNEAPPAPRATSASGLFHELDYARRGLAGELEPDQWARIRSAKLSKNTDEHHENLTFAVDAEGLETVTTVIAWGWRQAAEGAREVKYQCGTFSKSGQGWTHLLAEYRASLEQAAAAEERKANPPEPVELELSDDEVAHNARLVATIVPEFMR